jgi:hypothetical protein
MSKDKKKYQIDITEFPELQDAIMEYFLLMTEILDVGDFDNEELNMNLENNKIIVEGSIPTDEPEPEPEEEDDWEWI